MQQVLVHYVEAGYAKGSPEGVPAEVEARVGVFEGEESEAGVYGKDGCLAGVPESWMWRRTRSWGWR